MPSVVEAGAVGADLPFEIGGVAIVIESGTTPDRNSRRVVWAAEPAVAAAVTEALHGRRPTSPRGELVHA